MKYRFLNLFAVAALVALLCPLSASAVPILGSDLATFAVLGASTVTNVPASTIGGNVGVWSSGGANAITGFNSTPDFAASDSQVTVGLVHAGTTVAQSAQAQLTDAITNLGLLGTGTLLDANLRGLTLSPGVYTVLEGTTNLSGELTLDAQGNDNAFWLFQMQGTLITSSGAKVNLINTGTGTGTGTGVFWNVRSSATLGSTTSFEGNILALTSITLDTGATIGCGRALANTAAVTMHSNTISNNCTDNVFSGSGLDFDYINGNLFDTSGIKVNIAGTILPTDVTAPAPVPEPSTMLLLGAGLAGLVAFRKRFKKA